MGFASDLCLAVLALFLPPLVVAIKVGCSSHLLINILLDFLGWIPGVIHAWYIIFAYPKRRRSTSSSRPSSRSSKHSSNYYNTPLPPQPPMQDYHGGHQVRYAPPRRY